MLNNRVPPPVLTIAIAIAMWFAAPDLSAPLLRTVLALGLFFIAGAIGLPAMRAFRRADTTIDPVHIDRASALVTDGVYGITRNPMYVSLTLMLVAWAVWLGGLWVWAGPIALFLWLDVFQIRPEERVMAVRFGAGYADYRRRVRRWI